MRVSIEDIDDEHPEITEIEHDVLWPHRERFPRKHYDIVANVPKKKINK